MRSATRWLPSFPLLGKELIEVAARRRTYVIRVAIALLLLLVFAVAFASIASSADPVMGMLGQGEDLFTGLALTMFCAVGILQPALGAASVTHEKEQGSLQLLLLTPMRPWELVLQKWASRVLAMLALLVPALPLLGVAYAFGGFSADRIWLAGLALLLASMQLAALSLAVSCWCRGSTAAFFLAYVAGAALWFGQPLLDESRLLRFEKWTWLCPAMLIAPRQGSGLERLAGVVLPLLSTAALLAVARGLIVRRASLTGGNRLLHVFRRLDGVFERAEAKLGRRAAVDLPLDSPVAWREVNRRSFANARYLWRIFLPLHVVVLVASIVGVDGRGMRDDGFVLGWGALMGLTVLATLVQGAGLVSAERGQQTLQVLLTTPLGARQILRQKLVGMRRLQWLMASVLAVPPLIALVATEGGWEWDERTISQLIAVAIGIAVVVPAIGWLGVLVGLRSTSPVRAVVIAVIAALAWIGGVPLLLGAALIILDTTGQRDAGFLLFMLSPAPLVLMGTVGELTRTLGGPWLPLAIGGATHIGVWLGLRHLALSGADYWLRRSASDG